MRRLPGQAARGLAVLLHRLATLALALAVLAGAGVAVAAWRLSQGPLDLPWLADRIEEAVNANGGPTRLAVGSVALAWEGFRLGLDRPLDLRVADITITDQAGARRMAIPAAEVSLSLRALLLGRIEPRAIELDSPVLTVVRAADGGLSLDIGSLAEATDTGVPLQEEPKGEGAAPITEFLSELARPPTSDMARGRNTLFSQLIRLRIHGARIFVVDRQLGVTWRAPQAELDLARRREGGVDGTADVALALGTERARLTASVTLAPGATATHLRARLTPVAPSALAQAAPGLAALAALDAPVSGEVDLDLGADLAVRQSRLTVRAGAGEVHIGQGSVPIVDAALVASGTPNAIALQTVQVTLRGHAGGPPSVLQAHGTVQREAERFSAALALELDQVDFADLTRLWPEGTGGHAREWITENITGGTARNGHVDVGIEARDDFSSVELTRANGTLDGEGLAVHWLRPIPPITGGRGQLRILDPDTLEIAVTAGRQQPSGQKTASGTGGLVIRGGRMRITGIMQSKQISAIDADIAGPVPDAIALLREPRLRLLDRHPIDLKDAAGQATVKLAIGLPLDKDVNMDAITIHAQAHLEGVHLSAVAAGRDLDQGVLDLDATADGLKLSGRAQLAAIPARLDAAMDFRTGPPTQVLQTVTVSGQPDVKQLAAAGLDATAVLAGTLPLQATLTERRNGQGELAVTADVTDADLTVPVIEWRKLRGTTAKASARVTLDHDRLTGIENIVLDGDGLAVRGRANCTGGRITLLAADRLVMGRTTAQGTLRLPDVAGGGPIVATINGASVDFSARFVHHAPERKVVKPKTEPPPGPPWTLDARFDRALMAQDRVIEGIALHAENDGRVFQRLRVDGQSSTRAPFHLEIAPERGGRRLTASAADAGEVLRGLDLVHTMQGGRLSVQGSYDDAMPGRPLSGSADIEDFRIREAPALGKLLQAMTLYGLVEVMKGPGLGFSRLVAPFRLTDDAIELVDARAFSASLGLTAKGRIDLNAERIDMQGTIVPAYFFNSLLGNIPLVGKLFSPERGGGLFAASYTLRGPLMDPDVFVNPLTALTPGFLRGLFGIF